MRKLMQGIQHQCAIKCGRRSTTLKMAEHAYTRFLAGALLDLSANDCADSPKPRLADFGVRGGSHERAILLAGAFRNDDDREFFSEVLAFMDFRANTFVGERNLRNQDHV